MSARFRLGGSLLAPSLVAGLLVAAAAAPAFAQTTQAAVTDVAAAKPRLAAGDKAARAKDWATALTEYQAAYAVVPSAAALEGVATAHYELKHAADAYDAYDRYLKDFGPALPAAKKSLAEGRLKALAEQTGILSIRVNEPGAKVTVDGADAGTTPISAVLRVTPGPHQVQVTKDGFAPVSQAPTVSANGKAVVEVTLTREAKTGHLVVREKAGAPLQVVLDGAVVGTAPYEAEVDPGSHEVSLRGPNMAAPPQKVDVARGKVSEVTLVAVQASAHLEVATGDRQGVIFLDGVQVGEGDFTGEVSVGPHVLKVTRDGYEPFEKPITLAAQQSLAQQVTLAKPEAAPLTAVDEETSGDGVYGGFGVLGVFEPGGNKNQLETGCSNLGATSCDTSGPIGIGLSGWLGYSWHPVGIELFAEGSYDETSPTAHFDGTVPAGSNPLNASVARDENFFIGRAGFLAALRARVTVQSARVRGSLAAGFGLSYRAMFFDRRAQSTNPPGLTSAYGDKSGESYLSPALSIDGSVSLRLTPSIALALGLQMRMETASDDTIAAGSKSQYIGGNGTAVPIPTPGYHLASGSQIFVGPYLGMQFGP